MSEHIIAPITEEDIEGYCAALDRVARERKYLAFLEGPTIEMARDFVHENRHGDWPHFVAKADGNIIGWCDISSLHRPAYAHCGTLGMGIIPEYRGKGIGEALLRAALEKAKANGLTRIELTVVEDNLSAFKLYQKVGFVTEGLMRNASRIDGIYKNHIIMSLLFD